MVAVIPSVVDIPEDVLGKIGGDRGAARINKELQTVGTITVCRLAAGRVNEGLIEKGMDGESRNH